MVLVTFTAISVFLMNAWIIYGSATLIAGSIDVLNDSQAIIILGASVTSRGELSPVLKGRADTAIAVYNAGKATKILVSGDNANTEYNEVVPVRDHLIAAGIPPADIFLDFAGFDTFDTMYRAKAVFLVESAIIVTQSFHLPRAVFLADAMGINVQGLPAGDNKAGWYNNSREIAARVKAFGDILFGSTPTYLGKPIPITGDGEAAFKESIQ